MGCAWQLPQEAVPSPPVAPVCRQFAAPAANRRPLYGLSSMPGHAKLMCYSQRRGGVLALHNAHAGIMRGVG